MAANPTVSPMNGHAKFVVIALISMSLVARAEDVVVSSAAVTQVHGTDPGLKTFELSPRSSPITLSLTTGIPQEVEVFRLFTDENKVNVGDGDEVERDITATVTLGAPVNQTFTFHGKTVGVESFDGVPANIIAILEKPNPSPFEIAMAAAWAQANPSLVDLAGGLGRVRWTGGEQVVLLGGGREVAIALKDGIYNPGMNFQGEGPGNAGAVNAVVVVRHEQMPIENFKIGGIEHLGQGEVEVTWEAMAGYSYDLEVNETGREEDWRSELPHLGMVPVVGQLFRARVQTEGKRTLLIHVSASIIPPEDRE